MNGEIPKPVSIRKSITNPETGGTLTVIHKKDVIADTLGHVLAIPRNVLAARPQDLFKNTPPELVDMIIDRWRDVPWKGEHVVVRIGHVDPIADWERTKARLKHEGKFTAWHEKIGKVAVLTSSLRAKLSRASFFDPYTHTAIIMRPVLATAMHELGHAQDILGESPIKGLFTKVRREQVASYNAMTHLTNDDERRQAMRVLEPFFASYVGGALQMLGVILGLPVWSKKVTLAEISTSKGSLRISSRAPLAYLGTIAAAYLYAHLPWRKSTFGYVFEGSLSPEVTASKGIQSQESLQPHQVYTATARAK